MGVEVPFHVRIKKKRHIKHTATRPVHGQADEHTCACTADAISPYPK